MLIIFQIFLVAFSLLALSAVYKRYRDRLLGPRGAIFWTLFWLLVIITVVWPESASVAAHFFGIGRGSDLVVYVSLAIMFFILFRLHIKIESIGRDVTKVVRKEALEDRESP